MLPLVLGVVVPLFVVIALLVHAAGRARARALADDVRSQVEPYLRRKAAEAELVIEAPTWTQRSTPETIVEYSVTIATRLLEQERSPSGRGPNFELAQTQPVDDISDILIDTGKQRRKIEE